MNEAHEPTYLSYLLRLWRSDPGAPWRASLHSTATGEIHRFADLERMLVFLNTKMAGGRDDLPAASEPRPPE